MKKRDSKEFLVPSDLALVTKTSGKVFEFLKPLSLDEAVAFDVRLCFEEALINAMKYGNKLQKDKPAKVVISYDEHDLRIEIEDQGEGFDPKKLADCTTEGILEGRGRGVYLMYKFMDKVEYNSKGNRVLLTKHLKAATKR
jgi:anti-sigma regulatory factor (Ser/Thr protein kinase)